MIEIADNLKKPNKKNKHTNGSNDTDSKYGFKFNSDEIMMIGVAVLIFFIFIAIIFSKSDDIINYQIPTVSEEPTPTTTITQTPTPTIDPDPLVDCQYSNECGGTKKVRFSECTQSACCKLDNSNKIMKTDECSKAMQKEYDDKLKEYNTNLQETTEQYKNSMPTYNPPPAYTVTTTITQTPTNYKAPTNDPVLYQQCMDKVLANYKTNIANGMYSAGAENIKTSGESDCRHWYKSSTPSY